jgi:hypothetical protein
MLPLIAAGLEQSLDLVMPEGLQSPLEGRARHALGEAVGAAEVQSTLSRTLIVQLGRPRKTEHSCYPPRPAYAS